MQEHWEQRGSRSALPSLPTYCYLHPRKKICLCTGFKACLAMAKGARLAASEREGLCLSAQWVQREKGTLGAAAGIGRETIVLSPSPAPFPLQNCLPQGWMPAGRGTRLPQPIQQTPLCLETACTQPGLEKSQLPNSSRISQKFEGIHKTPNRHAASGQRPKLLPKTSPPALRKPMLRAIPPSPHPAAGRCT